MNNFVLISLLVAGTVAVSHSTPLDVNNVRAANDMWIADIEHGIAAFNDQPNSYQLYRNVMDFGCRGDGVTDDTACINSAISSGARCGENCGSSTVSPALIYFPTGRYLISSPIIMYYYSQLVGNAKDLPTLVAAPGFSGMAVLDSDPYLSGGAQWYTNQNNFFRQVRNFNIDLTQTPSTAATTGIHWQVAQATSLVNIHFIMTAGSQHQGIWMENGVGGFMSDMTFEGGKYGMWVGNQQFLSSRLSFNGCDTAIYVNWDWEWTFKSLSITNCRIGIDMSARSDSVVSGDGSILLLDSTLTDTTTGVLLNANPLPNVDDTSGSLLLDNVKIVNVGTAVADVSGAAVIPGGTTTITSWGRGSLYTDVSGHPQFQANNLQAPNKSPNLLDGAGNFYERARPQYEQLTVDDFASVKAGGARGDGVTDDSDAIQAVINANVNGKVVYFPAGAYIITKTITVPSGIRMIGETWSLLMASGSTFQDEANPVPMLRVGNPGDVGSVEITDFMFSTVGAQPGAILVEWNLKESSQGAAGLWDSHFRVGGFKGSQLQVDKCPRGQSYVPQCVGAHTLLHITASGSALLENIWAWTADHDLDSGLSQSQVSIYTGRGILVEANDGPVWMYGVESEHNTLYQYQLNNAKNVFVTMIQSETPYWQPSPPAPQPFTPNAAFNDPTYSHCPANTPTCTMAYALRAVGSSNVYIYGAGMYNFFFNYDQTCLNTESCQDAMVDLEGNSAFYMYSISTKAAVNMVVSDNTQVLAVSNDNSNGFCQTINAFLVEV